MLTYTLLALANAVWREDGTSGLDYGDEERTAEERSVAARVASCLGRLLRLLRGEPVRDWCEVEELEECLALVQGELVENAPAGEGPELLDAAEEEWQPELVRLGDKEGLTVARARTSGGVASFATEDGPVAAYVYKARNPDVASGWGGRVPGGAGGARSQRLSGAGRDADRQVRSDGG